MAGGFIGLNPEEVRNLARQMDTVATQIESEGRRLTSMLGSTTWVGNDRTQFENDWTSNHASAINNVVQAIRQASQVANRNADDQESVSS